MTTKPEAIRALNDELRQNLTIGTAFITPVSPPSAPKPLLASSKPSPSTTISATPMTHTKNTILVRSRSMARRSFSRSIISTTRYFTRPTRLIRRSPSASSPSCWRRVLTAEKSTTASRGRHHGLLVK